MFNNLKQLVERIVNNVFALLGVYILIYCTFNIILSFYVNTFAQRHSALQQIQQEIDRVNGEITVQHKNHLLYKKKTPKIHTNRIKPLVK